MFVINVRSATQFVRSHKPVLRLQQILLPRGFRDTPGTLFLDTKIVHSFSNFKESIFAPVGTPAVPSNPVFCAIDCFAPSEQRSGVAWLSISSRIFENSSTLVFQKIFGYCLTTRNRTTGFDLLHHCLLSPNNSILSH